MEGGGGMKLRLSEAIRLGAMLKPQGFGAGASHSKQSSCALWAAYEAAGCKNSADYLKCFGFVTKEAPQCPVCGKQRPSIEGLIAHCLNDTHHWTREQIADWLEREVEPQFYAPKVDAAEAVTA
jgi:hypothetical protein